MGRASLTTFLVHQYASAKAEQRGETREGHEASIQSAELSCEAFIRSFRAKLSCEAFVRSFRAKPLCEAVRRMSLDLVRFGRSCSVVLPHWLLLCIELVDI